MQKIGFLTYELEPKLTDDDSLILNFLSLVGHSVRPIIWDGCTKADFAELDLIIFRSCWDFHLKIEKFVLFLEMLTEINVPVLNSAKLANWNLDKKYLLSLEDKGFLIPKTFFVERGSMIELDKFFKSHKMSEAVIKPAISADGFETKRVVLENAKEFQTWLNGMLKSRTMMVQEFVPEILTEGEISFIFFNGSFSHAVRKRPGGNDFRIQSQYGGTREAFFPDAKTLAKVKKIVSVIEEDFLCARVDVIPVGDELVLIELELIDPFLFLSYSDGAPERFARAICSRLTSQSP